MGAALLSGLLGAGTASAQLGPPLLELRTPSLTVLATATEDRLTGPNVQLQHAESFVRGWAFGHQVALTIESGVITGFVGEFPVRLVTERTGDTLAVTGVFAGRDARLLMSEARLSGTLTVCQFSLKHTRERYVGWRTCGIAADEHEPVYLNIPPVLAKGRDVDLFAMLIVLLTSSGPGAFTSE